jgi:hypothetical protein
MNQDHRQVLIQGTDMGKNCGVTEKDMPYLSYQFNFDILRTITGSKTAEDR